MRSIVIVMVIGILVYFAMVTMGSAFSFGAGGGEITVFSNEAKSIYGEAVSIQGNTNAVASDEAVSITGNNNHVGKNRATPITHSDNAVYIPFIIIFFVIGCGVWAVAERDGDDEWDYDERRPSNHSGEQFTIEELKERERKYS